MANQKLYDKINSYTDTYFKVLHKPIKNVPYLTELEDSTVKEMVLLMHKCTFYQGCHILRYGQAIPKAMFLLKGTVLVTLPGSRRVFQKMSAGSFNFVSSLFGHESLFDFYALTKCSIMTIDKNVLMELAKSNSEFNQVLT